MPEHRNVEWNRSSWCESNACVEVAFVDDAVWVRNSGTDGLVLTFGRTEWDVFMGGVRNGEFDFDG